MMNNGVTHDGVPILDLHTSKKQREVFEFSRKRLDERDYEEVAVPSVVSMGDFHKQDLTQYGIRTLETYNGWCMAGSAETGILVWLARHKLLSPMKLHALNQCFRKEADLEGWMHLRMFYKHEQYCVCHPPDWEILFEEMLKNAEAVCDYLQYNHRRVNLTAIDPGYHKYKVDIEVLTETYGWMEVCSCTYFADEQAKRFGLNESLHTLSCTGVASPRILIPWMEQTGEYARMLKAI